MKNRFNIYTSLCKAFPLVCSGMSLSAIKVLGVKLQKALFICLLGLFVVGALGISNAYALPDCADVPPGSVKCRCSMGVRCDVGQKCDITWTTSGEYSAKSGRCVSMEVYQQQQNDGTYNQDIGFGITLDIGSDEIPCPPSNVLRSKHQAGCWSCLVVEKLTSTFLNVAEKAYPLAQRAGLVVLWIGFAVWVVMWGLKNVSSLAQVEPGNILNELLKALFKVGLAYWFIMNGLSVVREYFITPIMGTGSVIAEQFWDTEIKKEIEEFDWADWSEEEERRMDQEYQEDRQEQIQQVQQEQQALDQSISGEGAAEKPAGDTKGVNEINAGTVVEMNGQKTSNSTVNAKIPNFKLPGASGSYTSNFGCRPRPKTSCKTKADGTKNNYCGGDTCYGSAAHKGIDIGAPNGTQVYAIASGTITYNSCSGAEGCMATIKHDSGDGKWLSQYMHMLPASIGYATEYNKVAAQMTGKSVKIDRVAQGQVIGFVGNTGASGGNHLHLGIKYNGDYVSPLDLPSGKIVYMPKTCNGCPQDPDPKRTADPKGYTRGATKLPAPGDIPIIIGGDMEVSGAGFSGSSYSSSGSGSGAADYTNFSHMIIPVQDVEYSGPTNIMPKSVMNSILGATRAITNTTAENMVLGEVIMCYAKLERGGAWHIDFVNVVITNIFMWAEGAIIFCFGLLLTVSIVYYLIDISFKLGFAVLALPITMGLWPYSMTKDKFGICVSIIVKAAATFAFLALTTTYAIQLTNYSLAWGDSIEDVAAGKGGIAKLYEVYDEAADLNKYGEDRVDENVDYVATKLAIFSTTFVLLLFAFLYSFKLVQDTVSDFTNKFFPDKAFGENANPMHQMATAATRWAKDQAMKPVGYARDIALHQGGELLKKAPGAAVGGLKRAFGGKKEDKKEDKKKEGEE